ncbi:cysteine-rich receptor-like protein kinase 10 [Quercus suber]|uniref:cysteine-rich receptor-like protein kinase 10 n=1 Tax=Quercus suber TaxID=58331 RepID=UPI0032DEFAEB
MEDKKITFGFVFYKGDIVFTWTIKKQPIMILCTWEAKYIYATSSVCHAICIRRKGKISPVIIIAIVVTIAASAVLVILAYCFLRRRARKKSDAINEESPKQSDGLLNYHAASEISADLAVESLQFDFVTIEAATNKFSDDNKIGEGGFGKVYKGVLLDGKEVAVKRFSSKSLQGLEEFKNEIILIAKLQHRNLVRLLGFGIEGEEKLLVYEFMPNKSLDIFIFDSKRRPLLDWKTCYNIISGIARGLLYLHEDSRH